MIKLKDLRESKNFKEEDIAKVLGVSTEQYNMFETGVKFLSYEDLIKIAKFYDTSIDYILGLTNEVKPYPKTH